MYICSLSVNRTVCDIYVDNLLLFRLLQSLFFLKHSTCRLTACYLTLMPLLRLGTAGGEETVREHTNHVSPQAPLLIYPTCSPYVHSSPALCSISVLVFAVKMGITGHPSNLFSLFIYQTQITRSEK